MTKQINNKFESVQAAQDYIKAGNYTPFFKEKYLSTIVPELQQKFNIKNIHLVPSLQSIWLSCAISNTKHDNKLLYKIYNALYLIGGVKPVYTKCSRSISQFKIYKGVPIGVKCQLSHNNMYEFLERLVHIYLPNTKNFIGIKAQSIKNNSLSIGMKDMSVIKEASSYLSMINIGFTVTIILNNAQEVEQATHLLKAFDLPIRNDI